MENNSSEIPHLTDDGLLTPPIKAHSLKKYQAISYYLKIFSTSMKDRWTNRVYIDLFSGSGRAKVEDQGIIVPGSPLLALGVADRFDKYIFCEKDPNLCAVLTKRVSAVCEPNKFKIIPGDVNQNVEAILAEIPKFSKGSSCLSFCLVDPFSIRDIKFKTIRRLAELYVDFLVLIPSGYDGRRNQDFYLNPEDTSADDFFGDENWRSEWEKAKATKSNDFALFVLDYFCEKMKELRYLYGGPSDSMRVQIEDKNVLLYHLMLFSRKKLGQRFWTDTKKNINPQTGFDFQGV
jgi:three-Cys-motif partner protein